MLSLQSQLSTNAGESKLWVANVWQKSPHVRFMLQRFHFASRRIRFQNFHMRGVQGVARGSGSSARTERSSPHQPPFHFCTSAFRVRKKIQRKYLLCLE
jgi:hypothetical protein